MSELSVKDGLSAMEVASYLRRHSDFLKEFPDLAMLLRLPREQGPAASLASYQLEMMRDKNNELSRRLHDLVEIAHENETLMVRVHTLTLALMRARDLADTVTRVVASLTEDFHTDLVRMVLFHSMLFGPDGTFLEVKDAGEQVISRIRLAAFPRLQTCELEHAPHGVLTHVFVMEAGRIALRLNGSLANHPYAACVREAFERASALVPVHAGIAIPQESWTVTLPSEIN